MYKKLLVLVGVVCSPLVAPADELNIALMMMNNYNMRQDQDIWARMRQGFKLSHEQSKQVLYYERLYTKSPKTFARLVNNAKPYIYYILTQTERNGMPSEIALLPGVESTFNPNAKSSSNAFGMWQFVPSTGKRFNLAQNSEIDERQDLIKSTQSALSYLNYLHRLFGQWEPAIGAYNWGEGNMYKEVVNSGQTPGNINYSSLKLRDETSNYLPKLIALASIIENPEKFGVDLGDIENKPFFAVVNPDTPTAVSDMVSLSGIDRATFNQLNPQYKSSSYTVGTKDSVILPLNNQAIYLASIGKSNGVLVAPTPVAQEMAEVPANSEPTIAEVPVINGSITAPAAVVAVNDTDTTATESPEATNATESPDIPDKMTHDKLDDLITVLNTTPEASVPITSKTINYTVATGDTLYSIARRFGASVDEIRQQNKIPGNNLNVGQTIIIKPNPTTNS